MVTINITPSAQRAFKKDCRKNDLDLREVYMRVFIKGGGRAGLAIEKDKSSSDYLVKTSGIKVLVDKTSASFLEGAVIGYQKDGTSGYTVTMPTMENGVCSGCSGGKGCC